MRRLAFLIPALLAAVVLAGCTSGGADADAADANADAALEGLFDRPVLEQAAYLYGFRMGDLLRQQLPDTALVGEIDYDLLMAGFRAAFRGDSLPYSDAQLLRVTRTIDDSLLVRSLSRQAEADTAAAAFLSRIRRARASADSFMTANARQDTVETTESGLQYVVLQPGEGESPARNDVVLVNLTGRVLNGQTLVSSEDGTARPVQVGAFAVEGINEALLDMKPGERRRIYVPPALAFGLGGIPQQGAQPGIPPAAVVVFDVTLERVLGPGGVQGMMPPNAPGAPGAEGPPPAAPPQQ